MVKIIEVKNKKLKVEKSTGINLYSYKYENKDMISGEFKFKMTKEDRDTVLCYQSDLMIKVKKKMVLFRLVYSTIGNSISIGIGNGRTWQNLACGQQLQIVGMM